MKTKIIQNKRKVLESISDNEQINIFIIAFILKCSIKGKGKAVSMKKVAFIFDAVIKGDFLEKENVLLSSPWNIPFHFRELIIIAHEKRIVELESKKTNEVKLKLGEAGKYLLGTIENQGLFSHLRDSISKVTKNVQDTSLDSQTLMW